MATPARTLTGRDPIAAVRAGDVEALGALYRDHADALLAVAYRLLWSREDAEDVVHDLFVGLPEALRRYEERGAVGAWLKRVAVRLALSRLRARERSVELDEAHDVATRADDAAARTDLAAAMQRLSPALRAVLVLKEIEGYTHEEIATMVGISKAASQVRLHRALNALRQMLSEEDQ